MAKDTKERILETALEMFSQKVLSIVMRKLVNKL